jgi:putative phage-type endonuclease
MMTSAIMMVFAKGASKQKRKKRMNEEKRKVNKFYHLDERGQKVLVDVVPGPPEEKVLTRDEWLEQRRNHLGASEVPAVLGKDPRRGPLAVYHAKVNGYTIEDNKVLKYGREMEAPIANMFKDESGRPVIDPGATKFVYHPDIPWLAATLDRETAGSDEYPAPADGPGALEIKNIDIPGLKPEEWNPKTEKVFPFVIQNQIQIACTGWEWGCVAGKFPYYRLAWFDQLRNDNFLEAVYPVLKEFWDRVQNQDPPPPDELPDTINIVKSMYPTESGSTIKLELEHMNLADEWERAKATANDATKEKKKCEAKLRAALKENTFGTLPDGTVLSLKTTKRNGYFVEPTEYRTLRRSVLKKG